MRSTLPAQNIEKKYFLIDAKGDIHNTKPLILGRLAAIISKILLGKHKVDYSPHQMCGDIIVVINARHVAMTGNKADINNGDKFYWHTGYVGGIKETTKGKMLVGKNPEKVLLIAIRGMMKRNNICRHLLSKHLKIYADDQHKHQAQKPEVFDIMKADSKISRS